jgi:CBS domain-containing protein
MSAVSEIMSPKKAITADIASKPSALDVVKLMVKHKVGSVILVDGKSKPVGIITERDVLKKLSAANKAIDKVSAKSIMSSPVIDVKAYDSIETAASVMAKNKIKRLAVIEQDGNLVGMLSVSDITSQLATILTNEYERYSKFKNAIELVNG